MRRWGVTWHDMGKSPCFQISANNRDEGILVLLETCCRITWTFPDLGIYQSTLSLKQPEYTVLDKYSYANWKYQLKSVKEYIWKYCLDWVGEGEDRPLWGATPWGPLYPHITSHHNYNTAKTTSNNLKEEQDLVFRVKLQFKLCLVY